MSCRPTLLRTVAMSLLVGLACSAGARADFSETAADWAESAVPPPPSFDLNRLVPFSGVPGSALVYGVDPASIQISKSDGLVRYVVVARSPGGASNVMYDAIRCSTAEFKSYARYSDDGGWRMLSAPQWRSLSDPATPRYALRFARAGACDNTSPPRTAAELAARLKNFNFEN